MLQKFLVIQVIAIGIFESYLYTLNGCWHHLLQEGIYLWLHQPDTSVSSHLRSLVFRPFIKIIYSSRLLIIMSLRSLTIGKISSKVIFSILMINSLLFQPSFSLDLCRCLYLSAGSIPCLKLCREAFKLLILQ